MRKAPEIAKGRVQQWRLPKKPHQWEVNNPEEPIVSHHCTVCFKQKPGDYNNYNECPGYPDLFLHFKEDVSLIMREGK